MTSGHSAAAWQALIDFLAQVGVLAFEFRFEGTVAALVLHCSILFVITAAAALMYTWLMFRMIWLKVPLKRELMSGWTGTSLPVAYSRVLGNRRPDGWTSPARTISSKPQLQNETLFICFFVKSLGGASYVVKLEHQATVARVKQHVALKSGICEDAFYLVREGKVLRDGDTLECLGVVTGHATAHVFLSPWRCGYGQTAPDS